ncbi:hypothetical protein Tco_0375518, partial [Tanacetum coccineum]
TLCVLGKFDGKLDEGFLVGYSLNSKAYRVYNLVTKRVEVNLHVNFLEEKPNVKGVRYRWMFDIDYLTDSINYIPVSLENQAKPHAGTSSVTNHAGTSEVTNSAGTPNTNASEEEDKAEELIVVPTAIKHSAITVGPRKSSTNSKEEKFLTEFQNLQTQEKEAFSTGILEDTPEILAFRRDLDQLAQKHLREVTTDKATNTNSVNSGSEPANTQPADQDNSDMPELTIFNKPQKGIFDEASYDEEGMVHNFNNLPTEVAVSPIPTLSKGTITKINNIACLPASYALVSYVLSNSESKDASNSSKQGRNLGEEDVFETPKGKDSGEADISPSGLQAVETLVQVASQKTQTYTRIFKSCLKKKLDVGVSSGDRKFKSASEEIKSGFINISSGDRKFKSASEEIKSGFTNISSS